MSCPEFTEDDLLPVSGLAHVVFCARRAALHHLEGQWEDNLLTVEGGHTHDRAHEGPRREVRGDLLIVRGLRVRSFRLGVSGVCDVVEFGRDEQGVELTGREGRWQPFPIEYKRGRLRHEPSYRVQVCAQAMCLEEMLGCSIPTAALFYAKTGRRQEVDLTAELRADTSNAARRFHEIMAAGRTPPPDPGPKCDKCSMAPLCLPRTALGPRSASSYLASVLANGNERAQ